MIFLLVATTYAMFSQLHGFLMENTNLILIVMNVVLIILTAWLLVEGLSAVKKYRDKKIKKLDII